MNYVTLVIVYLNSLLLFIFRERNFHLLSFSLSWFTVYLGKFSKLGIGESRRRQNIPIATTISIRRDRDSKEKEKTLRGKRVLNFHIFEKRCLRRSRSFRFRFSVKNTLRERSFTLVVVIFLFFLVFGVCQMHSKCPDYSLRHSPSLITVVFLYRLQNE